jgi:hypothetical protein
MTLPSSIRTTRSMAFFSSRTLPVQGALPRSSLASFEISWNRFP